MSNELPDGVGANDVIRQVWLSSRLESQRQLHEREMENLIQTLVELADDVQRFCADPAADDLPDGWRSGLSLLHKKIIQRLADIGVSVIETVGRRVDPSVLRIVEVVAGDAAPETILREVRAGYYWKDKVLRMAEVVTSSGNHA